MQVKLCGQKAAFPEEDIDRNGLGAYAVKGKDRRGSQEYCEPDEARRNLCGTTVPVGAVRLRVSVPGIGKAGYPGVSCGRMAASEVNE